MGIRRTDALITVVVLSMDLMVVRDLRLGDSLCEFSGQDTPRHVVYPTLLFCNLPETRCGGCGSDFGAWFVPCSQEGIARRKSGKGF